MVKLNEDVLYLIFEELKDDNNALYSCLSTNRTWCKIAIPILWKNPWNLVVRRGIQYELLLNVIILHLSNESRNTLKNICIDMLPILTNPYQRPLFDYISFCRNLDLFTIEFIIRIFTDKESKSILMNEIINLFINGNRKYTHLSIPDEFNCQIHLIPGARSCLSEIEFLSFYNNINDDIMAGLADICKSIKKLVIFVNGHDNCEIIRLIEAQQNLYNLDWQGHFFFDNDKQLVRILQNSLIKHANNIRYLKISKRPYTKILTSFVNLKVLESACGPDYKWKCLENSSLSFLQILRIRFAPIKFLMSLIENTSGYLIEIILDYTYNSIDDNKRIIQVIYRKCPNLIFLKSLLRNDNILELENLLINCQYLNGLRILIDDNIFDWDKLFEILIKSSPKSLFKFKFNYKNPNLNSLKLFFDNWKSRNSMYLQLYHMSDLENLFLVINKYKSEGIIKKFSHMIQGDDFEWI